MDHYSQEETRGAPNRQADYGEAKEDADKKPAAAQAAPAAAVVSNGDDQATASTHHRFAKNRVVVLVAGDLFEAFVGPKQARVGVYKQVCDQHSSLPHMMPDADFFAAEAFPFSLKN